MDSQFPLDRFKRHPLAQGFLNCLPSLPLEERRLAGEAALGLLAAAALSVLSP